MKHPCFATFDNGIVASVPKEHVENMSPERRKELEEILESAFDIYFKTREETD